MKNASSVVFFLILIIIFSMQMAINADNLLPDTCLKISQDDPNVSEEFCLGAFGSDPGSSAATLVQLGPISFRLDMSNATSISATIDGLLKDPALDLSAKEALQSCSDLYSGVQDDLKAGLDAYNGGDYDTANTRASAAMNAPTTCEEGFKESKAKGDASSPLTKEQNDMSQLVAISLVLLCSSLATITTASLVPALCKDIARSDPHQVNYDFCVSQLESDPRSSNALAPQVGQISFELSITKAKNMSSLINKLLNDSSLNQPTAKTILSDCSKLYADEVQVDLESGLKELKDGDLKTANAKVTSALYAAATCEEGFKDFWNAPVSLLSISKANTTSSVINKVLKIRTLSPPAKTGLEDCSKLYSEILGDLKAGRQALNGRDFSIANARVSVVLIAAVIC
ncbi:hypothetical protein Cgig2_031059 [Carnegiea gigantea]|uniref:Pectinesterase inhibitor domain-containing protein n=1 Tax=Carnegiea gigantea TaxID=171969 RepID=A0A9Q1KD60_9CARY|nr:hypothetical protein Cgig2_031059 [Carnegiea gigantea]